MLLYELFIPVIIIAFWLYPWQLCILGISLILLSENKKYDKYKNYNYSRIVENY